MHTVSPKVKPFERANYRFDRLCDGRIYALEADRDYKIPDEHIMAYLYRYAKRKGFKARCSNADDGVVVVQFYRPKNPPPAIKKSPLNRVRKYPFVKRSDNQG